MIVGIYVWNFPNGLSNETQDWSNFGGYIGGTLGPLFAFLAFLSGLQSLNEISKRKQKDDLLNSIKLYEKNLQESLSMVVSCDSPLILGSDMDIKELPLRTLLQSDSIDWEYHLKYLRDSWETRVQPNGELFKDSDIWLKALNACNGLFKYIQRYENVGGDKSLIEYYTHTYEVPRNRLKETEWKSVV